MLSYVLPATHPREPHDSGWLGCQTQYAEVHVCSESQFNMAELTPLALGIIRGADIGQDPTGIGVKKVMVGLGLLF